MIASKPSRAAMVLPSRRILSSLLRRASSGSGTDTLRIESKNFFIAVYKIRMREDEWVKFILRLDRAVMVVALPRCPVYCLKLTACPSFAGILSSRDKVQNQLY